MTSAEFTEALAYYSINPWGPERDNLHSAIIAAAVRNSAATKRSQLVTPNDFMLIDPHTREQNQIDEFFANLDAIASKKE